MPAQIGSGRKTGIIVAALVIVVGTLVVLVPRAIVGSSADDAPHAVVADIAPHAGIADAVQDGSVSERASLPRFVDLGSETCVPCKMMAPILDELSETYAGRFEVEFIDAKKNKDAAQEYGVRIIPTQIFYDVSGKELFRHQGFFSREEILATWVELGYEFD